MRIVRFGAALACVAALGACATQPVRTSVSDRALAGALAGGLIADATDQNVATTAAIGALAGMASCGMAGMPPCS